MLAAVRTPGNPVDDKCQRPARARRRRVAFALNASCADRVTPSVLIDSAQTPLIIRHTYFSVTDHVVQLKLTVAELDALPRAMTEDKAAGSPRLF